MFCKYCGNEITDDSVFCAKCGKKVKDENTNSDSIGENTANEDNANSDSDSCAKDTANEKDAVDETGDASIDEVVKSIEDTNPLCIAGLVLTILMFFFNYCGLVGFAAIILSLLGYKAAKKNGQKGTMMAIVCMAVAGITSLIFIIRLIEYNRYESAVYGGINGLLELLGDL
ncbi:MAG: zinc-ribbon domain-containing protein [Treponema sp.]|nr:zinc-ribbon domain-containing protein [Treponema sp.]